MVRRGPSPPDAARLVLTNANAVTVIDSPPFEVTESGWGEFEINVQIYIHDCNEKPIEVSHILKLYPDGDQQQLNASKPVVSERYDEIVFNDPSDALRARLETPSIPPSPNGWKSHPNAKWFTVFDMDAEFAQLQQVRRPAPVHTARAPWHQQARAWQVYQMVTAELQSASKRRTQQAGSPAHLPASTRASTPAVAACLLTHAPP